MTDALSLYLREASALRFDARSRNCGLWVAEWVRRRTAVNPAAGWSGDFELDLLATADAAMAEFAVTSAPSRGDVGVVAAPRPTAALCVGRRWAALAPSGLAMAPWPVLRAWAIPHA